MVLVFYYSHPKIFEYHLFFWDGIKNEYESWHFHIFQRGAIKKILKSFFLSHHQKLVNFNSFYKLFILAEAVNLLPQFPAHFCPFKAQSKAPSRQLPRLRLKNFEIIIMFHFFKIAAKTLLRESVSLKNFEIFCSLTSKIFFRKKKMNHRNFFRKQKISVCVWIKNFCELWWKQKKLY